MGRGFHGDPLGACRDITVMSLHTVCKPQKDLEQFIDQFEQSSLCMCVCVCVCLCCECVIVCVFMGVFVCVCLYLAVRSIHTFFFKAKDNKVQ